MASSSSSHAHMPYDVFLSFRGETRRSFTDHLYADLRRAGVNTFRDDESIQRGEDISVELSRAIEESRISIIVFSKDYAGSRWCLDELVKIMECKEKLNQIVFPIFYDVDPSKVRNQKDMFGDALTLHRERFGDQKVNKWKVALTAAANLSGWNLQTGYESKFIEAITKDVLEVLKFMPMNVAKHPVGIDSRVQDILDLLQTQTNDGVQMIGIYGMGGVGKSTIAKAIYNHLVMSFQGFEGSCFVANIRSEVSERHNGLVRLQKKLLHKILKRNNFKIDNVDEGISLIKARLQSKKVLIVLDDINHANQLDSLAGKRDWFGPGSVIIITTRDVHLLSNPAGAYKKYKVDMLSTDESLGLLSWHAFDAPKPLEDYVELSKMMASYTNGLPLALTIIGSHLCGNSVQEWRDYAEKLKKIPLGEVQEILKISYDALDDDTQNIFLDIACFFIGHDKNNTEMILKACNFHPGSGIKTLTNRCLLTINKDEKFEMHDLIRDMGREVVRKESPQKPGKRSRLVDPEDVIDVLQGEKGTDAIQGMILNSKDKPFNTKAFEAMKNLRILKLDVVHLNGSFEYLSHELRLLRLFKCDFISCSKSSSDSFFGKLGKLVELDISHSNIKEFQQNMQHWTCLKILKLDGCEIKKMPDFTGAHSLEKVSFRMCSKLVEVHKSIGNLKKLVELDMSCTNIIEFQLDMTHLTCLKILKLDRSEIKKTPNFTGALNLEKVSFFSCLKLVEVHPSIGSLKRLVELDFYSCSELMELPISICGLKSLEVLNLGLCRKLKQLPNDLGNLEKLRELCARGTAISNISFSSGCLRNLPIGLGSLTSLSNLDLSGCFYIRNLPFSLHGLCNLKKLCLNDWQNLRVLEGLPPNLESLSAGNCVKLEKIADISTLQRLKELYIPRCKNLAELSGLETLENLHFLEIRRCSRLTPSLVENWFQARSKGDSVKICLEGWGADSLTCHFPTLLKPQFIRTTNPVIRDAPLEGLRITVRSKATGNWIVEGGEYIRFGGFTEYKRIGFEVRRRIGEILEVYAEFMPAPLTLCLFEIHRNINGEWRFFPSTRGWLASATGYLQVDKPTTSMQVDVPTTSHREKRRKLQRDEDLVTHLLRGFRD